MPFPTNLGTICEMIPPAPMHTTLLKEKISWSKPKILRCRSSAPGIAVPRSLIGVLEPVNAGCIALHSFSVDLNFKVLIHPDEAHIAVAAEDSHQCEVSAAFKPSLKLLIRA